LGQDADDLANAEDEMASESDTDDACAAPPPKKGFEKCAHTKNFIKKGFCYVKEAGKAALKFILKKIFNLIAFIWRTLSRVLQGTMRALQCVQTGVLLLGRTFSRKNAININQGSTGKCMGIPHSVFSCALLAS
jgi:hypothetical protein